MKGPAIFLAQFAGDAPPFNSLEAIARWAGGLGFKGGPIPTPDPRILYFRSIPNGPMPRFATATNTRPPPHFSTL